jgi:hypothetical protein
MMRPNRSGQKRANGFDGRWTVDAQTYAVCATPDGLVLRKSLDGKTVAEARRVSFRSQQRELFEVPRGYEPALAPEGGVAP